MTAAPPVGLGTTTVCQIGLVVRDVERTARAYADILGLPMPTPIVTDSADKTNIRYRGETTPARAKLMFFSMGQVIIELIEPIDGPSTWQEFLDLHGEGVHHIAFMVQGMEQRMEFLRTKGCPTVQMGDYPGGRYAYVDTHPSLGVILELLENFNAR